MLKRLLGSRPSDTAPPRRGTLAVVRRPRAVRARFDSAQTTADNRRHWAAADGLSPNAAVNPEVRRILRNRSRYEVANNSYAKGIVLTLANDTIGTGPRLQMLTEDADANRRIEEAFSDWARAVDLAAKLRTARMARAESGEAFGLLTSSPMLDTPVKLDVRLVEPDQVCSPWTRNARPNDVDGIVFDAAGNPIAYHVMRRHPGDGITWGRAAGNDEYDTLPASAVLHYFRADRPSQWRGIPDITPALPLFAQLRRYTLAVIAAATPVPEPILEAARWWGDFKPGGNLRGEHPEPIVVTATPEAGQVFDALTATVDAELAKDGEGRSLWARAEEKACRLALVYACSACREQPVIDEDAASWACGLSEYLTRRMLFVCHEWVAEGLFDARQKRVLRIIRRAGGSIGRSELCRRTQSFTQRERQEVIDNLLETGQITQETTPTAGRRRITYALA